MNNKEASSAELCVSLHSSCLSGILSFELSSLGLPRCSALSAHLRECTGLYLSSLSCTMAWKPLAVNCSNCRDHLICFSSCRDHCLLFLMSSVLTIVVSFHTYVYEPMLNGFNPWTKKVPHAMEQLNLCATTIKPVQ